MTELKDRLVEEFPGKMENQQAFLMTFIMNEAQKGNSPLPRAEIEKAIEELISEGIFEKKGNLLILKAKKPPIININDEEDEKTEEIPKNLKKYPKTQQMILKAFQGKFENRAALLMNATMDEIQQGNSPPKRTELEMALDGLIKEGKIEQKGDMLIKKV